jgi:hypothetical protein
MTTTAIIPTVNIVNIVTENPFRCHHAIRTKILREGLGAMTKPDASLGENPFRPILKMARPAVGQNACLPARITRAVPFLGMAQRNVQRRTQERNRIPMPPRDAPT